jgi:CRISPR/Cas system-associated exonuclease Cas4 (RecB family)
VLGDRLRRAADRLAMISCVARTGAPPAWARDRRLLAEAEALLDRLRTGRVEAGVDYGGLSGPQKLSFSRINQYRRCPRCYLLFTVLGLPQRETPHLGVGTAAHAALEHFAKAWRDADSEGLPLPGWTDLERLATEKFHEHWPRTLERDPCELERVQAQMRLYWEQLHDADAHISEFVESHFEFPLLVDGVAHKVSGKIDRIDHHPAGGWRLIDYKTGSPRKDLLEPRPDDLQMGIYARALESLVGERGVGSTAEYWVLSTGERGVIALDDINQAKIDAQIHEAVRGMASGNWEKGKKCSGECDFLDDARLAPTPGN